MYLASGNMGPRPCKRDVYVRHTHAAYPHRVTVHASQDPGMRNTSGKNTCTITIDYVGRNSRDYFHMPIHPRYRHGQADGYSDRHIRPFEASLRPNLWLLSLRGGLREKVGTRHSHLADVISVIRTFVGIKINI